MSARTLIVGLVAGVLALTLLGAAPATADPKPYRQVGGKIVNVTQHKLAFKGKVFGAQERAYAGRITWLQKKTCRSCNWRVVKRERTNSHTRYRYPVGAPRHGKWFYRVVVPETRVYRKSFSDVYYTYRV